MVVRGATVPEALAAVAVGQVLKSAGVGAKPAWGFPSLSGGKYALGNIARNTSGDEVVSGLGFEPVIFIFLCCHTTSILLNFSWGFDIVTTRRCIYVFDSMTETGLTNSYSIYIKQTAANQIAGLVSDTGVDGFTVTFTLTGVSNAQCTWLAIG